MSTILDALRKSERIRRAGKAPAYGNASQPSAPPLLRWTTILAGLALLAALLVFVWLLQRRPPEIVVDTVPAVNPEAVPAVDVAPVAAAVPAPAAITSTAPMTQPEAKPVVAPPPPATVLKPAPAKPKPAVKASSSGAVAPWSSLSEAERAGLPPLRVNIHVYSPDEAQRILYIDNEPRVRGEEVTPGMFVEEIVPEGAIVRYRGQRYLLPRPT
jgi:general secretion pathway protein B